MAFYICQRHVFTPYFMYKMHVHCNRHILGVSYLRKDGPPEYCENKTLANKRRFTVCQCKGILMITVALLSSTKDLKNA